jgi:uncharacterized protein YraI
LAFGLHFLLAQGCNIRENCELSAIAGGGMMKYQAYLALVLLIPMANADASGGVVLELKVKAHPGLRMRSGPGLKYKTLGLIPNGAFITPEHPCLGGCFGKLPDKFEEAANLWAKVVFNSISGWVSNEYLFSEERGYSESSCKALAQSLQNGDKNLFLANVPKPFGIGEHVAYVYSSEKQLTSVFISIQKEFAKHGMKTVQCKYKDEKSIFLINNKEIKDHGRVLLGLHPSELGYGPKGRRKTKIWFINLGDF